MRVRLDQKKMKDELTRLSEHIGLEPSHFLQEASPPDSQPTADSAVMTKLSARVDGVEAAFREYIQDTELESQLIANREVINRLSADMEALKSAQKGDSSMVRALRALQKLMSQPDPSAIFAEFDVDGDKQVCSLALFVSSSSSSSLSVFAF